MTMSKKRIAILGATGSIGDSTLAVILQNPEKYQVMGLSGFSRLDKLLQLCQTFLPKFVCVPDDKVDDFNYLLKKNNLNCEILAGKAGLDTLASHADVDIVVASIVGSAGLSSTLSAIKAGKTVLLANKESLVMAGELMMKAVATSGATLLPVDSEHNAIFQCLPTDIQQNRLAIHDKNYGVKKLWLTASGGSFLYKSYAQMQNASVTQAVNHPNWSMGKKISVDSSTMMNKGLELIEASFLFHMPVDNIDVAIHPQSIIHSMVEYVDGSFLAQLGKPDMKTPIAHALAYPNRMVSGVQSLDIFSLSNLTFLKPDLQKFHCLTLAYHAMRAGSYACIALNASNEVAVSAFLNNQIRLTDIATINDKVLNQIASCQIDSVAEIFEMDKQARQLAQKFVI